MTQRKRNRASLRWTGDRGLEPLSPAANRVSSCPKNWDRLSVGFPPYLAFTADTNQKKGWHEQPLEGHGSTVVDLQHTEECAQQEGNTGTEEDSAHSLFHLGSMPSN